MSVKRYEILMNGQGKPYMEEPLGNGGDWVKYEDYAALESALESSVQMIAGLDEKLAELESELERTNELWMEADAEARAGRD